MWLLTSDDLREATGFEDAGSLQTSALEASLDAATTRVGAELQTGFDRATRTEVFFVTRSMMLGCVPTTTLLLSQGFVASVDAAYAAVKRADVVTDGSPRKDLTGLYNVDMPRGRVTIQDWDLTGNFVAVTYTAGFAAGTGDAAKLYQGVPGDLAALAQQAALVALDTRAPQMRHAKDNPPDLKAMEEQLAMMLRNYRRGGPGLIRSQ